MNKNKNWLDRLPAHYADPNMSKRSFITNITPLPAHITRDAALALLHDHTAMIELNPLVLRHEKTTAPPNATPEEIHNCKWILITDTINYLPGGAAKSEVSYKAGFYDLPYGIQTHCFAPGGVDLKAIWRVGGNMPGEKAEAPELGIVKPSSGLYLREDVEVRCNVFLSSFVKRNLKKSHGTLVEKLLSRPVAPAAGISQQQQQQQPPPPPRLDISPVSPTESIGSIPSFRPMTPETPESVFQAPLPSTFIPTPPISRQSTAPSPLHQPQAEEPCYCGPGGHEVMCVNYRYGAPPPRRPSPAPHSHSHSHSASRPSVDMRWPPTGDMYSPVGTHPDARCNCPPNDHALKCQYYIPPSRSRQQSGARVPNHQAQAKDNHHGRMVWKLPPGGNASPSVAYRSPQLFGEQAELPGDTMTSERDEDWGDDETMVSEMESRELVAYWEAEAGVSFGGSLGKEAPGDAGWI